MAISAEIVSVGTELLLGQILDTHAPAMAKLLAECGIGCRRRTTLGDNFDRLVTEFQAALSRSDVLITIGGLGPTGDDLTRDAVAAALGDELVLVPEVEEALKAFFAKRNLTYSPNNSKQAYRPESAELIDNPNGTAPGLLCRKNGKVVICLPGPGGEFNPMARGPVKTFLQTLEPGVVIHSRTLRVIGIGESSAEHQLKDLMEGENPTLAPYAHVGEVHLRMTARANSVLAANQLIDPLEAAVRERLGNAVYATDDTTLEEAVVNLLVERGRTLAVAESMTGGSLGARLTSVQGSSKAFVGGFVVYNSAMKASLLGVDSALLAKHGPVSRECAEAMATCARDRTGADFALAITGNAGPDSDIDGKPVGLTYLALATSDGVKVEELNMRGVREDIRRRATQYALQLIRDALI